MACGWVTGNKELINVGQILRPLIKAIPSGILVSGPGKVQNWMRAGGFSHYAIFSQTSCKDGRYHISAALKTYSNHKVSEILRHIAWFY